jgi:pSer/pThr/pTyr-binding forkhead associated (FHA) protein
VAIVDLGSTNGTVVNGVCLRGARAALRGGERIEIGTVVLEFLAPS